MNIDFFTITFIALVGYFAVFSPISGHFEIKRLRKDFDLGKANKVKFFNDTILWSWIPVLLIVALVIVTETTWQDIGIKWIDFSSSPFANWINYILIGLSAIYFAYTIYTIYTFKNDEKSRKKAAASVGKDDMAFLPITAKEKKAWRFVALSAGTTEEIAYRGYFFYALAVLFPELSMLLILLITTLLFGIGHIYQGKKVIQPAMLGLFYGASYIALGSILPVIILHILQDLVVTNLLDEDS